MIVRKDEVLQHLCHPNRAEPAYRKYRSGGIGLRPGDSAVCVEEAATYEHLVG